eukprot:scaffold5333_cov95-Skeletonema_dohrnii-CCMP3373.AAC.4
MNIGTKVEVRFAKSRRLSGTIARVNNDETCDVDLDSGEKEKGVPLVLIRNIVDSVSNDDAAVLSKREASEININSSNDDRNFLSIGDRVEAKFRGRGSRYYLGTIKNVSGGKYDIDYDDGDQDRKLSAEHVRKLDGSVEQQRRGRVSRTKKSGARISDGEKKAVKDSVGLTDVKTDDSVPTKHSLFDKGQRVTARYRGRGKRWYKGSIAECFESKNEYTIHYDDGDRDRNLSAEFIRAIDNDSEVVLHQENTKAADRDIYSSNLAEAVKSEEENKKPALVISTVHDGATKTQLEEATVELAEPATKEDVVIAPDDISAIVVPDVADGDVSFVVDSGHKTRKESSDDVPGGHTIQQDEQSTAGYSSGKGNRLYRGKVVRVKTIHLYEVEYADSTTDTNIPFGALRLPQGFNESDIKVGTSVDVLSWQDRFAAVL